MYGAYTLIRPQSLTRAAGLEPRNGPAARGARLVATAIGARDLVSGISMMLVPTGPPLRAAVAARVACDLGDAVGFGVAVPPRFRLKVISIAGGWGALCATALRAAGPTR